MWAPASFTYLEPFRLPASVVNPLQSFHKDRQVTEEEFLSLLDERLPNLGPQQRSHVLDAAVVDHGMRSLTALPVPIRINELPLSALKWIPGVGAKQAGNIFTKRPVKDRKEFRSLAGVTPLEHLFSIVTSP